MTTFFILIEKKELKQRTTNKNIEEIGPPFFILFLTREKEEKKFKLGDCYQEKHWGSWTTFLSSFPSVRKRREKVYFNFEVLESKFKKYSDSGE